MRLLVLPEVFTPLEENAYKPGISLGLMNSEWIKWVKEKSRKTFGETSLPTVSYTERSIKDFGVASFTPPLFLNHRVLQILKYFPKTECWCLVGEDVKGQKQSILWMSFWNVVFAFLFKSVGREAVGEMNGPSILLQCEFSSLIRSKCRTLETDLTFLFSLFL